MNRENNHRTEKDLLGEMILPDYAYYGIQTARALENFKISNQQISEYPYFVKALALVKLAAARANFDTGGLEKEQLDAIEKAAADVMDGKFNDQFALDVFQGGAGTSTNMNINEVLRNVALEYLGEGKGNSPRISSHDHLNLSQSTNDFYPTAVKVALILKNQDLLHQLGLLIQSLRKKNIQFREVLKMGRTEMQVAVPMTLGQEFLAFADGLAGEIETLTEAESKLQTHNMGGTAIGTGLNARKGFSQACSVHLSELMEREFKLAGNLIAATSDTQPFVIYSSVLKSLAVKLSKMASDLILLSSGPITGFFEINLPPLQPGSSIMPGKVNPVIPELINQVAFRVVGNDVSVGLAAQSGQLQLNAYEPLIALATMESQKILTNAMQAFREKCIDGITANESVLKQNIERSVGIVTALNPILGYHRATELAKEALDSGKGLLEIIREKKILTEEEIRDLLNPAKMTGSN